MRALIQRVNNANVTINDQIIAGIDQGVVVLVGFHKRDNDQDVEYIINKLIKLRIFKDENQQSNLSIQQIKGSILSVSQFTLYADISKGNRPSFSDAADYEYAEQLYNVFNSQLKNYQDIKVYTGVFGSDMNILINNSGPFTVMIDSRDK